MTRWEKLSGALLRLIDEARQQRGAIAHLGGSNGIGRVFDALERIEGRQEEIHASHQKALREITALETRFAQHERQAHGGE